MDESEVLPIRLGSLLFSMVDPFVGSEFTYNRWYERDHYFAGGTHSPYVFSGQRWVATSDLKALRYVTPDNPVSPDTRKASYLHLYYILAGANELWRARNQELVRMLYERGRMEGSQRHTIYTINPTFEWDVRRDPDGVPPELALEHRFPGLVLTFSSSNDGTSVTALSDWFRKRYAPAVLSQTSPVALCLCLHPRPLSFGDLAGPLGLNQLDGKERLAHLWFVDTAAVDVWESVFADFPKAIADGGLGNLEWSSPFLPVVPGTDRYVNQLGVPEGSSVPISR